MVMRERKMMREKRMIQTMLEVRLLSLLMAGPGTGLVLLFSCLPVMGVMGDGTGDFHNNKAGLEGQLPPPVMITITTTNTVL